MHSCKILVVTLFLAVGCQQKLDVDKTADLDPGDEIMYPIDAPTRDQRVTVTAQSGGVEINLFIVKAKTDEDAKKIIQKQTGDEIFAKTLGKVDPTLETVVPGGTAYYVAATNPSQKEAKVSVKITGRAK